MLRCNIYFDAVSPIGVIPTMFAVRRAFFILMHIKVCGRLNLKMFLSFRGTAEICRIDGGAEALRVGISRCISYEGKTLCQI